MKVRALQHVQRRLHPGLAYLYYATFFVMDNLLHTNINLIPNKQSHAVLFNTDLYDIMTNTNGALSIYAWLYNKFKDYKEASQLSLYKTIAGDFIEKHLNDAQKRELDAVVEEQYDYFYDVLSTKREKKFDQSQYWYVTALYDILGKRKKIPHTTSSHINNNYTSTQTSLLPSYAVAGHGGPSS